MPPRKSAKPFRHPYQPPRPNSPALQPLPGERKRDKFKAKRAMAATHAECVRRGKAIQREAQEAAETLVKHAGPDSNKASVVRMLRRIAKHKNDSLKQLANQYHFKFNTLPAVQNRRKKHLATSLRQMQQRMQASMGRGGSPGPNED